MQLQIRPYPKNIFPTGGILIKSPSVIHWVRELQRLQLGIKDVRLYPIPGTAANTVWGCLIVTSLKIDKNLLGRNELCQTVTQNLFIPERAILFPAISHAEIEKLFPAGPHIAHPEFGFATLTEEPDLGTLIISSTLRSYHVTKPAPPAFIPSRVKSFQLKRVPPDEVMQQMEEKMFPQKETMKNKPLNIYEKGKLLFYQLLFIKEKRNTGKITAKTEKRKNWKKIESIISSTVKTNKWNDKLEEDFEDLDQRNQNDFDKLMDLLRKNPEEALKYAIPLDNTGAARGSNNNTRFNLLQRWFDLSWTSGSSATGSGSVDMGDRFHEIQAQYNATAEDLVKQKKYHKAAFVYMKLLKNNLKAAETLETGSHYQEAATIYLKHAGNKKKAAECYEKGNMITDAIDIYEELGQHEKVGDLYASILKRKEANIYYDKVVSDFKSLNQYVKASLICRNKKNSAAEAQSLLLEGWQSGKDAVNCLNNYFSGIGDVKELKKEITSIYIGLGPHNSEQFLLAIKYEYIRKNELAGTIKDMAYEIVAANIAINPSIVTELKSFNPPDNELIKDTMRFKMQNKK